MADRVGQQLGNYRLIRLLGKGGFAEVYLGTHVRLGTQAAIKVLHTSLEGDDAEDFLREAQTVARLKHPHIVRVFDFDVDDHTPFLVMDYLPNGNVRRLHPKGTQLPLAIIVSYVRQVASALQYAHNEKLIHRDIKPENLLLDRDNTLVLSDFGIALMSQSSRYQNTQEVAGTAAYMAPEQFQGHPRRASDQYSLGVVVYEWLTGDRLFLGSFSEIASQHLFVPPPSLREKIPMISLGVEQVVQIALSKDPEQRFGSIQAFANALERAWQTEQLSTNPTVLRLPPAPPAPLARETPPSSFAPTFPVPPSVPPPAQPAREIYLSNSAPIPQISTDKSRAPLEPAAPTPVPEVVPASLVPPPPPPPPMHQAFSSVNRPTTATGLSYLRRRPILLAVLALLVIVGSASLFPIIANQVATSYSNTTATSIARANAATTTAQINATTTATAQINATATAIVRINATATATVYQNLYNQATSGTLALNDPLSDNSHGYRWSEGTACQFIGGAYYVTMAVTNSFRSCEATSTNFSNFAYQVQMKIIKGDDGGVAFRDNSANGTFHGYIFAVGPDDTYKLCLAPLNSGSCSTILSGASGAVKQGLNQTNLVTVIAKNDAITFFVNQQEVGSLTDNTFSKGEIGVIADDFSDPTQVVYNNAKVWTI